MRYVWDNAKEGIITRDAYLHLTNLADEKLHRSRATVINFLNKMTEKEYLVNNEKLGKGGEHGVYSPNPKVPCEDSFMMEMAMQLKRVAGDILNVTFVPKQRPVA